jgi:hypothetical protein
MAVHSTLYGTRQIRHTVCNNKCLVFVRDWKIVFLKGRSTQLATKFDEECRHHLIVMKTVPMQSGHWIHIMDAINVSEKLIIDPLDLLRLRKFKKVVMSLRPKDLIPLEISEPVPAGINPRTGEMMEEMEEVDTEDEHSLSSPTSPQREYDQDVLSTVLVKIPSPEEVQRVLSTLFTPEMMKNPVYRFRMENILLGGANRTEVEAIQREIWEQMEAAKKEKEDRKAQVDIARANAEAKLAEARIEESKAAKRKAPEDDIETPPSDGALCLTFMFETLREMLGDPALNLLTTACCIEDCDNKVSPFLFAVCGSTRSSLTICCLECAEDTDLAITRVYRMARKRALVWLCCAGARRTVTCAACGRDEYPIDILDEWELGHQKAKTKGGKNEIDNLFPVHKRCNAEQGALSLESVRLLGGIGTNKPFPFSLQLSEAKKELRKILF